MKVICRSDFLTNENYGQHMAMAEKSWTNVNYMLFMAKEF